jgi:AraC-like DNA-binding protein
MVTTTEILPCPVLQTYVRCYTLREFGTMGTDFSKPLPANHEFMLAFTVRGDLYTYNTVYKGLKPESRQHIIGLQTASKGIVIFNGDVKLFTIQFRPNGFYQLFGIPSQSITDNIFDTSDIIPNGTTLYNEQLCEAIDLLEMKKISDKFLLSHLVKNKNSDPYHSITSTSSLIFANNGNVNIKSLANEANMSLKRFEIKFTEQVGIPPKLFARITRFNHALMVKMRNMSKSWTDISNLCGYYDQMHFIKEFKEFAGDSPANFYKITPLPYEDYKKQ